MTILLIEDEPLAAERVLQLVKAYPALQEAQLEWKDSVKSARTYLQSTTPDLLLCDIQLGDGLSFDLFDQQTTTRPVIFITAFDQYAIRAFDVNSIGYILKPVQRDHLYAALDKFMASQTIAPEQDAISLLSMMLKKEYKQRFLVKIGDKLVTIPSNQISYFYVEDRTVLIRTIQAKTYIVSYSMEQLELLLDPAQFYRINRSCIVHIDAIQEAIPYPGNRLEINMQTRHNKEAMIVSRELCTAFRTWLGD